MERDEKDRVGEKKYPYLEQERKVETDDTTSLIAAQAKAKGVCLVSIPAMRSLCCCGSSALSLSHSAVFQLSTATRVTINLLRKSVSHKFPP